MLPTIRFQLTTPRWRRWVRKVRVACSAWLIVIGVIGVIGLPVHASPGGLDSSFVATTVGGVNGRLFSNIGSAGIAIVTAIALQPDGHIVVAGTCYSTLPNDSNVLARFCVQRYRAPPGVNPAASWLDPTFDGDGSVIHVAIPAFNAEPTSVIVAPDGRLYVAGTCTPSTSVDAQFCVVRLLANGGLDTSYGFGGYTGLAFPKTARLVKALLQPDGRLLLVGQCDSAITGSSTTFQSNFCLSRVTDGGQIDASYGISGRVLSVETANRNTTGATLREDGTVVVSGTCFDFTPLGGYCARAYDANGGVATYFGNDTATHTTIASMTRGNSLTQSASGGIVELASGDLLIAGTCGSQGVNPGKRVFCLLRLDHIGRLTSSAFGTDSGDPSRVYTKMDVGDATPHAMALQPDGKIIVAGSCASGSNATTDDFCAVRYHSNGELDLSFFGAINTTAGVSLRLTLKPSAGANAMVLQPDGKALLTGNCKVGAQTQFCTVRLEGGPYGYRQCTMDIDGDGKVMALTDVLIHARVAQGMSGAEVLNGLAFAPGATRTTWESIRDYLGNHCGMEVLP